MYLILPDGACGLNSNFLMHLSTVVVILNVTQNSHELSQYSSPCIHYTNSVAKTMTKYELQRRQSCDIVYQNITEVTKLNDTAQQ